MKKYIIFAGCFFLLAVLTDYVSKKAYPPKLRDEVRFVPALKTAELLSLDHRGFLADILFIRVNLHSGSLVWKPLDLEFDREWSFGIMDLVTDLDPRYYKAYLFTGMGLIHAAGDVVPATPILEKGMEAFPSSWELPFWAGYDHYVYRQDYETAAGYLLTAFNKPGAPKRFFALLLNSLRNSGGYEGGLMVLDAIISGTRDEGTLKVYRMKRDQLENLVLLQRAATSHLEKFGIHPSRLADLVESGIIAGIPGDPLGSEYLWDREKKRVIAKRGETAQ